MRIFDILNPDKLRGKQKNNIMTNKTKYDVMDDVSDVFHGYNYYINFLYEKLIKIFSYENLPETIPADALEDYILHFGYAGITNDKKFGLVAVPCTKYGVGLYPRYEPLAQYCTPLMQGQNLIIGRDIVIFKNNSYQISADGIVKRYARLLADFDATISIMTSNKRIPVLPSFDSEESAESYKAVMIANRLGQTDTVLDKNFIQKGTFTPFSNYSAHELKEIIDGRNEILRTFLQEIGITTASDKKERMVVDEVNVNSQLLLFNISDMLKCRQDSVKQVNELYGTNINVSLSNEYSFIENKFEDNPISTNDETNDEKGAEDEIQN